MSYLRQVILIFTIGFFLSTNLLGQIPDQPSNYVTDAAELLSSSEEEIINTVLKSFEDSTTHQIFVVLAHSLQGRSIEELTLETATRWAVGQKGQDNGLLIAIYANDRQMRFEVGYGLEANLTDYETQLIQQDNMIPFLKSGDYFGAVNVGIIKAIEEISTAPQAQTAYSNHYYQPVSSWWPPIKNLDGTWYIHIGLLGFVLFFGLFISHYLIGVLVKQAGSLLKDIWVRRIIRWGLNWVLLIIALLFWKNETYLYLFPDLGEITISILILLIGFFWIVPLGSWIDMADDVYYQKPKKGNRSNKEWKKVLLREAAKNLIRKRKTVYHAFGTIDKVLIYLANMFFTVIIWAQFGVLLALFSSEINDFGSFFGLIVVDAALYFFFWLFYQSFRGNLDTSSSGGGSSYSGSSGSYSSSSSGFSSGGSSFGGGGGGSFGGGGSSSSW